MRTRTLPLLIVGILITVIHFSCKKGIVYPPGTATVKYVLTTSSPSEPRSSIAWITADSGKTAVDTNFTGGSWTSTQVMNTNKGNWTAGSTLVQAWLIGDLWFTQKSTVDAKIYINGVLTEHQTLTTVDIDGTYYTGLSLKWTTQAPNPE